MSFLNTITDLGKSALSFVQGDSVGSTILKTIASGYALNKLSNVTKSNDSATSSSSSSQSSGTGLPTLPYVDKGVREQVSANQKNRLPLVYGSAQLGGVIIDAEMSNDGLRMSYCLAISEMTGTKLSDGQQSSFTFENIYWNDQKIVFKTDGETANYSIDRDNNRDYSIDDLVSVYCYNGGSRKGVKPKGFSGSSQNADTRMPSWTTAQGMNDIVFAIIQVDYSRMKNVTGLGNIRFHVTNSMTLPGDCLDDYMKSTRYGAGITEKEIYSE